LNTEPLEFVTGPEEVNLLMPYEEVQPLMDLNHMEPGEADANLNPGMLTVPEPAPPRTNEEPTQPVHPRPYDAPVPPIPSAPTPMDGESVDDLGWHKRDMEAETLETPVQEPQTTRRPELPIR
jgi:hypothetical protein